MISTFCHVDVAARHRKVNVISSCDLDWCRFKQTVCVDLCAPFAHVGSITERYMGVIGVMNTWFKWKICIISQFCVLCVHKPLT